MARRTVDATLSSRADHAGTGDSPVRVSADGATRGVQASGLRGTTRVRSLLLGARRLHDLDAAEDEALLLTRS